MVVLDAHQHVWDLSRSRYSWLAAPALAPVRRSIRFEESLTHLDRAGIDGSVLVQADDSNEDTDLMLEAAASNPRVVGVVGWVPLDQPEEAEHRLRELASPVFVGVRTLIHDMPDPDWILRPDVDEGLGLLERLGVSFDFVAVLPRHLENVATVSERHPGLRIVIDHLAKPPIGLEHREPWWSLIARASENPLVSAKLSGLYSATTDTASWTQNQLEPFFDRALEVFSPQRLMYGGDWPFSVPAGGYERTWPALSRLIGTLEQGERNDVLAGSAIRHYRLDRPRVEAALEARRAAAGAAPGHRAGCPSAP